MLEVLEGFPDDVVAVRAVGEVHADDYHLQLVPALSAVLDRAEHVRLLYEMGPDFTGNVALAAWHETEVGLEHPERWDRIAFVSDNGLVSHLARVLDLLVTGDVRSYPWDERDEAERWITQPSAS